MLRETVGRDLKKKGQDQSTKFKLDNILSHEILFLTHLHYWLLVTRLQCNVHVHPSGGLASNIWLVYKVT